MIFDLINITIGKEMVRYPLLCHANFIIDFIIFSYTFPHSTCSDIPLCADRSEQIPDPAPAQ